MLRKPNKQKRLRINTVDDCISFGELNKSVSDDSIPDEWDIPEENVYDSNFKIKIEDDKSQNEIPTTPLKPRL